MDPSTPRPPGEAGNILLQALLELARERPDVREALASVQGWLATRLPARGDVSDAPLIDKVLTPPDKHGSRSTTGPEAEPGRALRQVDLSVVVRRARWKGDACRFAVARRRAKESGEGLEEIRREEDALRKRREQLEDCYAWMLDSPRPLPDDALMKDVADCYDTVALASEIAGELDEAEVLRPAPPAELLYLLAESQSALLAALNKCELRGESDQRDLFLWLKDQTTRHRIYVDRHMRLDDPADSTGSDDLARRLRETRAELIQKHARQQARGPLMNKLRFHARKAGDAGEASDQDWSAVTSAIETWIEQGLPHDDRPMRDLVRGFVERHGEGKSLPEGLARILGAGSAGGGADSATRPAVREQAAALLRGRHALIFAEQDRIEAHEPIVQDLELSELDWVELPDGDPQGLLAEQIARPELDLVLIASRLPEDAYSEFKRLCQENGKPFVRLPGNLESGQVAHQILRQVGWRLRAQAAAEKDA